MKRLFLLLVILCFLTACSDYTGASSSNVTSAGASIWTPPPDDYSSSNVPKLPNLHQIELPPLVFDPFWQWGGDEEPMLLEYNSIEYEFKSCEQGFIDVLEYINFEDNTKLKDQSDIISIGEYVLFFCNETPYGNASIILDGPHDVQEIFVSNVPIQSLTLSPDGEIIVEFLLYSDIGRYEGKYYVLDLKRQELLPLTSLQFDSGAWASGNYILHYCGNRFFIEQKDSIQSIYQLSTENEKIWLLDVPSYSVVFANDRIYYLANDSHKIMCMSLDNMQVQEVYESISNIEMINLYGSQLTYTTKKDTYVLDLHNLETIFTYPNNSMFLHKQYCEDGFYWHDIENYKLEYFNYILGSSVPIMDSFDVSSYFVHDNHIYVEETIGTDKGFNRSAYYRVNLDGSNLIRLFPCT